MEETKTYVFPGGQGSTLDPNVLALMNGGGFGGGMNAPFWAIILLAFLRNNFGWSGNDNVNNGFVASQLNQAIAGNANALSNLSTHLDCSIGQVQTGIAAVQSAIQNVANQTGMSSMQVINSIQAGNSALQNQLASCCCDLKTAVNTGFGNMRYESAAQTCSIKQSIADQTATVISKLDAIEDSRKDREIASLTAALTAANSRAERAAELAPIYKAIEKIPNTVPVQWPQLTAIPTSQLYGFGYGFNPSGSIWS